MKIHALLSVSHLIFFYKLSMLILFIRFILFDQFCVNFLHNLPKIFELFLVLVERLVVVNIQKAEYINNFPSKLDQSLEIFDINKSEFFNFFQYTMRLLVRDVSTIFIISLPPLKEFTLS